MTKAGPYRVAIIGGGLAAMSTAERLGNANWRAAVDDVGGQPGRSLCVELFEAKRRTGGRAGSFQTATGDEVDYCQHVAMGCCTELLGMMRRASLLDAWTQYPSLSFRHPEHPPSPFRPARWLPAPLHLLPPLWAMRYLNGAQKIRLGVAVARLMATRPQTLVDVTAGDWLRRMKQDHATIERFWEVILVSALGESIDVVSMAVARKVIVDGFAAGPAASDVWVPNRTLAELFGKDLPAYLSALGTEIHTETTIRRISGGDDDAASGGLGTLAAECPGENRGFRIETIRGDVSVVDACVVAVPWHRLSAVLSPSLAGKITSSGVSKDASDLGGIDDWSSMPGSPITGVHLWFNRAITDVPHAVMVGTTAQWLFRSPVDNDDPHYYQVVISASHDWTGRSRDELIETVLAELRHEFPEARSAELVRSRVVTDPRSVFSATPEGERIRPPTRTSVSGLFLAGDWVQTGWPATMEGAVISGRMAAEACLEDFDRRPPMRCPDPNRLPR